jgi:hypothetical protein
MGINITCQCSLDKALERLLFLSLYFSSERVQRCFYLFPASLHTPCLI